MEHRWGIRQTLNVGVKLYVRPGRPISGRLLNASSSGGYVTTSATMPIMTRVHVTIDSSQPCGRHRIAAYVVRADALGVGIEWQAFAPPPVLALIDPRDVWPSREDRQAAARLEPPLAAHYTAQPLTIDEALGATARR